MDITTQKNDKISCLFIHKYKNLFMPGSEKRCGPPMHVKNYKFYEFE